MTGKHDAVTVAGPATVASAAADAAAVLTTFGYDDLGQRVSLSRSNGTAYGYDAASRLTGLSQDFGGTAYDQSYSLTYNPAGQIASRTVANDIYTWARAVNVDRPYAVLVVSPFGDQFDNAARLEARGVSVTIHRDRFKADQVLNVVSRILTNPRRPMQPVGRQQSLSRKMERQKPHDTLPAGV